jgi:hypothetical protein
MEKKTKEKLDCLMRSYENKSAKDKKLQKQQRSEEDEFLCKFRKVRKKVIRPAMEEIGESLKNRGHEYRISQREETKDRQGKTEDANIMMSIFPSGTESASYNSINFPSITFFATKYKRIVWGHRSTMMPGRGGSAGSFAEFKPEEIKRDMVERVILVLLEHIF